MWVSHMRRKEFVIEEEYRQDVEKFLMETKYGTLALNNNGDYPVVKALNYVYLNGVIYLHGSKSGEKMNVLKDKQFATFSITQDYSIIPSYLDDPYYACPASTLYKSVVVKGSIFEVEDEEEKHEVLNAFMLKLQPEGGYSPIVYEDVNYRKRVKATAVLKFEVEDLSHKFKFGQNWKEEKHDKTSDFLLKRNDHLDHETVALMKKYCPIHRENER